MVQKVQTWINKAEPRSSSKEGKVKMSSNTKQIDTVSKIKSEALKKSYFDKFAQFV